MIWYGAWPTSTAPQPLHSHDPQQLACDLARGMAYLHAREYYDEAVGAMQRCILHRDVKVCLDVAT